MISQNYPRKVSDLEAQQSFVYTDEFGWARFDPFTSAWESFSENLNIIGKIIGPGGHGTLILASSTGFSVWHSQTKSLTPVQLTNIPADPTSYVSFVLDNQETLIVPKFGNGRYYVIGMNQWGLVNYPAESLGILDEGVIGYITGTDRNNLLVVVATPNTTGTVVARVLKKNVVNLNWAASSEIIWDSGGISSSLQVRGLDCHTHFVSGQKYLFYKIKWSFYLTSPTRIVYRSIKQGRALNGVDLSDTLSFSETRKTYKEVTTGGFSPTTTYFDDGGQYEMTDFSAIRVISPLTTLYEILRVNTLDAGATEFDESIVGKPRTVFSVNTDGGKTGVVYSEADSGSLTNTQFFSIFN